MTFAQPVAVALPDHPQRVPLANELHARPFPSLRAPGDAIHLALKPLDDAARDREAERAHLLDLLDRHGAAHPPPGATHWSGRLGRCELKWESHTEFVTYLLWEEGATGPAFHPDLLRKFPADWLAAAPGARIASALIRVEPAPADETIVARAAEWFVPESLTLSRVLDDKAVVAGDFRLDAAGHMRFAVFAREGLGDRRTGRVVQQLCEIETYRAMAMLGFATARDLAPAMADLDRRLSALIESMASDAARHAETLHDLLGISAELEHLSARSGYRLSATVAYETIVLQRVAALRELRFGGRPTLGEFMQRRFDPAMRTAGSTDRRLGSMSARALRAGNLLRTRVDVERSAQNQRLLESMDRRADLALRLQHTVEGLSVVAVSYYAVGLALYLLGPLEGALPIGKPLLAALVAPVVILAVWWGLRRIRRSLH
ncbi:DUF3422 family protein [Rubellimicrobium aerolatum]|uniref:DUF3422 family protein n=1 Tax=Rubellimicrobium aerolatum TaxID=490979 RepID=A0ABW0SF74_9RHOB|nr:DUF3422 domain-containing protein [Rubellimicrobium aerolatum]MBP1807048.1 putative membrane-anchored protein [Rubellimicrobium aerolatum]